MVQAEEHGRIEFRILADQKHDREAAKKAKAADTLGHPPAGYRWVWLGEVLKGADPKLQKNGLIVPGSQWKDAEFAGRTIRLTGTNRAGSDLSRDFEVIGNTAEVLQLRPDPLLYLKSVSSFRIDHTPSDVAVSPGDDAIVREVSESPGRTKRWVLVKLDRHNVTEKDLYRVYRTANERFEPAVAFQLSREGGKKFGALTREHLPASDSSFRYRMGIILHGRLLSAPKINSEIRDAGIIEGGGQGFSVEEVEHIINILRSTSKE
jgi:SecD/SecF fusion protein